VFMVFAFGYGFLRFLIEIVRDDSERGVWGPHLTADVLIPGALAVFALGYAFAFARSVENVIMRRLTQIMAFMPAITAYILLRPASYVNSEIIQLSTSQWVAVLTAVAVSVAFVLYWKVAEAHPEAAMQIELDAFFASEKEREAKLEGKSSDPEASKDEGDDEEDKPKAKSKGRKDADEESVDAKFEDKGEPDDVDDKSGDKDEAKEKEPKKSSEAKKSTDEKDD